MNDPLEFLTAAPAAGPEELSQVATEPAAAGPIGGGPDRGPDGVAPASPTPTAHASGAARASQEERPSAAPPASPPPTPAEPGHVPLSAVLDERDRRQRAEQRLAQLEALRSPPPPPTPEAQIQQALYSQNLRTSRRFAERTYSPQLVATVHDWAVRRCDDDPRFNDEMFSSEDPYEAAMQAYSREQILQTVKPGDLEAFKAWQASVAQASQAGAASIPSPQTPAAAAPPPRSLATASGTGAAGAPHVPVGPGEAFRSIIG